MAYRVLGNDPKLSFMAEVLHDGSTRSFRSTRGAYYEQSGTNANAKLRKKSLSRFTDAWTKRTSAKTVLVIRHPRKRVSAREYPRAGVGVSVIEMSTDSKFCCLERTHAFWTGAFVP
jgi:hypothetical protein